MAPEVIRNENCSEKVDIWSYGGMYGFFIIAYRAKSEKNQTHYEPILRKPSVLFGNNCNVITYRNE
jgi:hypothetical protein